jgi:hypothetical protein
MNINLWRKALDGTGMALKYQDVLCGFEHGFHQGILLNRISDLVSEKSL